MNLELYECVFDSLLQHGVILAYWNCEPCVGCAVLDIVTTVHIVEKAVIVQKVCNND